MTGEEHSTFHRVDRPAPAAPRAARPATEKKQRPPRMLGLLAVAAVLAAAVWLGLTRWGLNTAAASGIAGTLFGLLVGAALPAWCQQLGDRAGISAKARKARR
ncbi:hypothetical protein ACQPYK_36250 [Streptosporangium sp. CA-135522]|uniref:hypothetical protein n=1 Tax=Streptosporangium sp. CA-135522 TaxID=3240072 RepID=UPI003D8E6C8C